MREEMWGVGDGVHTKTREVDPILIRWEEICKLLSMLG